MRRSFKQLRRTTGRRRLYAEALEDRRLLAQLSFLPTDGTPLQDGKLFAQAGVPINISARVSGDVGQTTANPSQINNYALNFTNSSPELSFDTYSAADSKFSEVLDSMIEGDEIVTFSAPWATEVWLRSRFLQQNFWERST